MTPSNAAATLQFESNVLLDLRGPDSRIVLFVKAHREAVLPAADLGKNVQLGIN